MLRMNRWQLRQARQVVQAGGVIAYPTEAVFGLGCDPWNTDAISRLLTLKRRSPSKGLILIAAALDQLELFLAPMSRAVWQRVLPTWPGPVTWLLPARPSVPKVLTGGRDQLAVRITAHTQAAQLCLACGTALVSTSANRSGRPPARTTHELRLRLGKEVDFVLPGLVGGLDKPTEIRDGLTGAIIRPGAMPGDTPDA